MQTHIVGGRIIDPGHFDGTADILVKDGKIAEIIEHSEPIAASRASNIQHPEARLIDASQKIVTPGLVDMHVHLREPGYEYKETIETECRAAASGGFTAVCWGGFTAVCCMPNTNPVIDEPHVVEFILKKAVQAKYTRVYPVAAISKGLGGIIPCKYSELKKAGAIGFSDDGNPVMNSRIMRNALQAAKELNLRVISHCEDFNLAAGGAMNEGPVATQLGYVGIPNASESIMVLRDIALSELSGASVHIAHVSAAETVRAIRDAKDRGIEVTAETAPHYFTLTDAAVKEYGALAKMNPPLRSERDRLAIREGLADGTIDAIATDHAPHSREEKTVNFNSAANGIIGLETSLSLGLKLVQDGVLSCQQLIEKMSSNPAKILGLKTGLRVGQAADLTIIDPNVAYTVESKKCQSLSRNTPFEKWHLAGRPVLTMLNGHVTYEYGVN